MAWDDSKLAGDNLTADEWNTHTTDQKGHVSRHALGGSDAITWIARGNNTISANITTVTVAHGFSSSPTSIVVSPTNEDAIGIYATSKNASNFTAILQVSPVNNAKFDWISIV